MASEIQRLLGSFGEGNEVFIKRDDLLPFSMGGNKVRIANAFFEDMKARGCDAMIIYGSRHSNLCRVLSNLCAMRQIPCVMICSHDEGEKEQHPTFNTILIDWTGTEIVHCARTGIADCVESVMNRLQAEGKKPYYIYGNKFGQGNEGTAAMAYAEAYQEILDYEAAKGFSFDLLFCPSGTQATQSGLICGHLLAGDKTKTVGILISSRETARARQVIDTGIRDYFQKIKKTLPKNYAEEIHLLDRYRQAGYGLYDERIIGCIREQYVKNSVPLDPVYTGKAFFGMTEYLREAGITHKKILFLHTGGTPLFYDLLSGSSLS